MRGRSILLVVGVMLGLLVMPASSARAAEVASTSAVGSSADKVRCSINVPTGANPLVKVRCYYDSSRNWSSVAGTDQTGNYGASPKYLSVPYPSTVGCSFPSPFPLNIAVGPQAAGDSLSGTAIPGYAFEATYSLTGTCTSVAYVGGSAARVKYISGDASTSASTPVTAANGQVWQTAAGWPNYPTDWYVGGSSGSAGCAGATLSGPSASLPRLTASTVSFSWARAASVTALSYRLSALPWSSGWRSIDISGGLSGTTSVSWPADACLLYTSPSPRD